jgi:hypothetical protein
MTLFEFITALLSIVTLSVLTWQVVQLKVQVTLQEKTLEKDHERRRKQATFEAMQEIRNEKYDSDERALRSKLVGVNWETATPELKDEVRETLTPYEYFATGVNVSVYDIDIVDRASGAYFIGMWGRYQPYIDYMRNRAGGSRATYYAELGVMCEELKKKRALAPNGTIA